VLEDSCFYSSVPAEAVTTAILKYASFHHFCCVMNGKFKYIFEQCFYRDSVQCQKLQQVFETLSFGLDTGPTLFCNSFIALSILRCLKSTQKFAVRMSQVTTVVMETA